MIQIDILHKITTPITCKSGRSVVGTATGFFFRYNEKTFLITNRHVFVDENKKFFPDKIIIRLNKEGKDLTQSSEIEYELYQKDNSMPLWFDLGPAVDLAILEINEPAGYVLVALTPDIIADPDKIHLGLGEQVLVIGYPRNFYDTIHNLPIVRSACVSSVYGLPFQQKQFFLIDSNLHPGTSGSPVITVPKSIYPNPDGGLVIGTRPIFHFLGINSGTIGDLQLNAIWYSGLILDVFKKQEQSKMNLNATQKENK